MTWQRSLVTAAAIVGIAVAGRRAIDTHARPGPEGTAVASAEPHNRSGVHQVADDVRAVWQAVDQTWNDRNAGAFTELFTTDGLFVFMDSDDRLEGRPAILERFSQQFPAMPPDLRHLTSLRAVRTIAPRVSGIDGTVEILREPAAGRLEALLVRSFAMSAVMLLTDDGWKIRELHVHPRP